MDEWITEHGTLPTVRALADISGYSLDTAARVIRHYVDHDLAARQIIRWMAYQQRGGKTVEFDRDDDGTLIRQHTEQGPGWSQILQAAEILMNTAAAEDGAEEPREARYRDGDGR